LQGALDREFDYIPPADASVDHRMGHLAQQRKLASVLQVAAQLRDARLLHEAPGHLFLEHEAEDLASFLQVSMLNGWGGYVLTHANYMNAFFSHDEYIDFFAGPGGNLEEVREQFRSKR
jgi:hypothetical protein